jgi:hypothetical protein
MNIDKKLAIDILKYLDEHKDFYFPFVVMCKKRVSGDEYFVEVKPKDWKKAKDIDEYQLFELWENLQNLYEETVQLMAKGFIEKIENESSGVIPKSTKKI